MHSTGLGANLPCILAPLGDICGSLCEAFTLADEKSLAIVFYVRDKILLLDNLLFLHSLLLPLSPSFFTSSFFIDTHTQIELYSGLFINFQREVTQVSASSSAVYRDVTEIHLHFTLTSFTSLPRLRNHAQSNPLNTLFFYLPPSTQSSYL